MELGQTVLDFFLHLDKHLKEIVMQYGFFSYAILFGIVFAETGLVILPFLPGDSLLFAAGALSALGTLNFPLVLILFIVAAIIGDTVNYAIGRHFGKAIVDNPKIPFINQEHIDKTEQFYKKHGGKTIILARFVPIVRTFAPFVAGVGSMHYRTFIIYNIVGGIVWVSLFTSAGYFFGNMEFVQEHFHYVIFAIIGLSIVPMIYEYIQNKRNPDVPGVSGKKLEKIVND
jgi:membrane-associated protein